MKDRWHKKSMRAAVVPVASSSAVPSSDAPPAWDRRAWLLAIPLGFIVAYAFIPILDNGFVSWDDSHNFLDNPYFRGSGPAELKWAWTTFRLGVYQPLAWMLFETQYVFCQLDPYGYHLTSLLLQVANAMVLYALTVALVVRCRSESHVDSAWACSLSAGLATALFAVHPLRVEAVAWVSCQPYLPCILFSMLAALAYLRAFPRDSSPRWGWLVGSFVLFVMALLFKAVAVSLPAVLLILDGYPLRRIPDETRRWFGASARRVLWEKVPFVATGLLFMGLAIAAKPESRLPIQHDVASEGIARACYAIWFYPWKTMRPLDLIAVYPLPIRLNWFELPYSACILATLVLSIGLFLLRRRWPGLLAAWLCYLVILAPNAGFIRVNDEIAADRYSYMAMLGSVVLVSASLYWLWRTVARSRPYASLGMVTIGLGLLVGLIRMTRDQCRTWRDTEVLWNHALTHGADSSHLVHSLLGGFLYSQGRDDEAAAQFTVALRLHPGYEKAHNNLGNVLYKQGKHQESAAHFTEAIRLDSGYADAHYNLGVALQAEGRSQEAEGHYTEALRLRPGYAEAHKNLGVVLFSQGNHEGAAAHFVEALRLNPGFADAHNSLGMILSRQGRHTEAAAHFGEAIRLRPDNAQAHYNMGLVLAQRGHYEAARAQYAEAIRLQPDDPKAYNAGAMVMAACPDAKFRDGKEAVRWATRACELTQWKNATILDTLAAAQAEFGDFDAAVKSQKRAIELLTDERREGDYLSRLRRYQARRPYRQLDPRDGSAKGRP